MRQRVCVLGATGTIGRHEADATPSTGTETLIDFHRAVLAGAAAPQRGDHAVF